MDRDKYEFCDNNDAISGYKLYRSFKSENNDYSPPRQFKFLLYVSIRLKNKK